jgi:plastocyanin
VRLTLLTLALCAALGVAGCGGDDDSSSGQPASTPTASATQQSSSSSSGGGGAVKISADPSGALKFSPADVTAKAGKAKIEFDNPSQVPHAVEIEGVSGSATQTVTGGKASVTVDLKPGKYQFFCPVDGHRAAGMVGTLTVQ